jgi:hypothetical protein
MKDLKVGDRVDVTRTEAVRVAIERAQADTADDFRHRISASVLFGWDNHKIEPDLWPAGFLRTTNATFLIPRDLGVLRVRHAGTF